MTSASSRAAFSLVELVVVMTLLSFIVLGLMAVFNQTQRAFKLGMAQVDVMESGRAAMDLIVRDLEAMAALPNLDTNSSMNFLVATPTGYEPVLQELPGQTAGEARANILQDLFFVSRVNQFYAGTAYLVPDGTNLVGTLYRYSTNVPVREVDDVLNPFQEYQKAIALGFEGFRPVLEGVIHFRVTVYRQNGFPLEPFDEFGNLWEHPNVWVVEDNWGEGYEYGFVDDALPTAVEVELAIVEPDVLDRIRALPVAGDVRRDYLATEAGKVHVFKQRVPIRRADPVAYR